MIASSGVLASVSRTQRALTAVHAARVGLTLAATALVAFSAWRLAIVLGLSMNAATLGAGVAVAGGMAAAASIAWRARHARDPLRVALWIEEHAPSLEFALVSAVDVRLRGAVPPAALEALAASKAGAVPLGRAYQRGLVAPGVALVVATLAALGVGALREGSRATELLRDLARPGAASGGALGRVSVTVRPPAYTRRAPVELRDPVSVRALAGSEVAISGQQSGDVLEATIGSSALRVERRGAGWRLALTVGARAAIVRLRTPSEQRLLSIEPVADSLPVVRLITPVRDTVFAAPPQSVRLEAEMTDDNGLASAEFEYIVSTGEGESFRFRSGRLAAQSLGARPAASLRADLSLPALGLGPGDVLHLRAVARDQNTVTGPGVGSSDTRVLRIQRVGEGDSVAVEGAAPPPADSSLMSQRMLIVLTEALVRRRPRITRAVLTDESRSLARQQSRLRRVVGDAVFSRLGSDPSGEHTHDDGHNHSADTLTATTADALLRAAEQATDARTREALDVESDETPTVAVNRPLLEAFNAMWAAQRELELAEPVKALPHMHAALAAIQRARTAERILLRSRPPNVVVDIDRVRLSGKDRGADATRDPRRPDDAGDRAADRFVRAMEILRARPSEAADSLLALRVDLLGDETQAAQALAVAVEGLRRGVTDTAALRLARRALGAGARHVGAVSPWSGAR